MKSSLIPLLLGLAIAGSANATDVAVTLSNVHLCCQSCVKGAVSAGSQVPGVTVTASQDDETLSLTGPDKATVQKAVDALVAGGFYGKSSDKTIKVKSVTGAKGKKVESLQVEGVHLCCDKCVKAVKAAVKAVPGVKDTTAVKGAKSFTVTGEFNDKEVFAALEKAGLHGQVAK
jgi:copper chaperone CopZ